MARRTLRRVARCSAALVAALTATATVVVSQALPGSTPGTEQWLVVFRSRAFSLSQKLAEIRGMPTRALREQKWQELEATVVLDQAGFRADLESCGGVVRRHFWAVNGMVAEIPTRELARLRADRRVLRLWPNEERGAAIVPPRGNLGALPTSLWTYDSSNHRIEDAWNVLNGQVKGNGVTIAFFDTGLDRHYTTNTGSLTVLTSSAPAAAPHRAFWADAGQLVLASTLPVPWTGAPTRLWESYKAQDPTGLLQLGDCNDHLFPHNPQPTYTGSGRHGTGVASIAAGVAVLDVASQPITYPGHAPRAFLVGFSITNASWATTTERYLSAIQDLRYWITQFPLDHRVAVLNISFDGWPDPNHPVSRALDELSRDASTDILVVVSAGNEGDSTMLSHGGWHPMSVGAVHTRISATAPYYPMIDSSRGPMLGEVARFYPDMCATGAGKATDTYSASPLPELDMAQIDSHSQYDLYTARGTSMAAPQVAGAAALYRARRLAAAPPVPDSALETRAALLLNVDDPYVKLRANGLDNYRGPNTFGVGYLRDDWLIEYAERENIPSLYALGQSVSVPIGNTVHTVPYTVRKGMRYAIVAAWYGGGLDDATDLTLPNVDLEVYDGPTLLARSCRARNSYERAVFSVDGDPGTTTQVTVRLTLDSAMDFVTRVFVAGRELDAELQATTIPTGVFAAPGQVFDVSQPSGCVGTSPARRVQRTIPVSYTEAYGSSPIATVRNVGNAMSRAPGFGVTRIISNTLISPDEVGGDFYAVGIAFRAWAPFSVLNATSLPVKSIWLYESTQAYQTMQAPVAGGNPSGALDTNVVRVFHRPSGGTSEIGVENPTWAGAGRDTWCISIPFDPNVTYHYQGSTGNRSLGVWIEMDQTVSSPGTCEIDWVKDLGYGAYETVLPSGIHFPGFTPVFGLIEEATANLPPTLSLLGEPRLGETLRFRIEQVPKLSEQPLVPAVLNVAVPPMTVVADPSSGCNVISGTAVMQVLPGVTGNGWPWLFAESSAFSDPVFLNADLYWQALVVNVLQQPTFSVSNIVVTRLGGFRQ